MKMSRETVQKNVANLKSDNVLMVYSGKRGCMCGCKGKYSYNPLYQELGTERRGYPVTGEDLNKGMITRVLRLMKKEVAVVEGDYTMGLDAEIYYMEYFGRNYTLYTVCLTVTGALTQEEGA